MNMRKQIIVYKTKQVIIHEENARIEHLLHEVLTETPSA